MNLKEFFCVKKMLVVLTSLAIEQRMRGWGSLPWISDQPAVKTLSRIEILRSPLAIVTKKKYRFALRWSPLRKVLVPRMQTY
jgi:hypothetical protein